MNPLLRPVLGPVLLPLASLRYNGGAKGYSQLDLLAATLDPRITFTRSTVKTYIDVNGALQSAAINTDPLEYDPVSHLPLGYSFWDSRTNLVLNSATLVTQNITTTAQAYALSFTGTGTVTLSGTFAGSLVGTGASTRVVKLFTATAGTLTLTVSGSVTQAQCEAGTTASPYIVTTTSQLRGADAALVVPLSAVGLSASAGTVYAEALVPAATNASAINTVVGLSDNTGSNNITMTLIAAGVLRNRVLSGAAQQAANDLAAVSYGSPVKVAFSYAAGFFAACANGGTAVVTNAGTLPVVTQLDIGKTGAVSSRAWNSTISRLRFYPHALSAAELQAITR